MLLRADMRYPRPAAEAVGGLCKAQKLLGHEVSVIVPRRPEYELAGLHPARRLTPSGLSAQRTAGGGTTGTELAQLPLDKKRSLRPVGGSGGLL